MRKRLVIYVGYDEESARILRKVMNFRSLFDDITVVYVPESKKEILSLLSIPSVVIEEV